MSLPIPFAVMLAHASIQLRARGRLDAGVRQHDGVNSVTGSPHAR